MGDEVLTMLYIFSNFSLSLSIVYLHTRTFRPVPEKEADTFTIMCPSDAFSDRWADINSDKFRAFFGMFLLGYSVGHLNTSRELASTLDVLERNVPPTVQLVAPGPYSFLSPKRAL